MKIHSKYKFFIYIHIFNHIILCQVLLSFVINSFSYYLLNLNFNLVEGLNNINNLKNLWESPLIDFLHENIVNDNETLNNYGTIDIYIINKVIKFDSYYFQHFIKNKAEITKYVMELNWEEFYTNYINDTSENKHVSLNKIKENYLIYMQNKMLIYYNEMITEKEIIQFKAIVKKYLTDFYEKDESIQKNAIIEKIIDIIPWNLYLKTNSYQTKNFAFFNYLFELFAKQKEEKHYLNFNLQINWNLVQDNILYITKKIVITSIIIITSISLVYYCKAPILTVQEDIIITEATKKTMEPPEIFIEAWVRFGPAVIKFIKSFFQH